MAINVERSPLINGSGEGTEPAKGRIRDASTQSGEWRTFINVTKGFVGAASFELPWAYMQGGVIGSLVGVTVLALLSRFALGKLAICGRLVKGNAYPTYPQMGYAAYGNYGAFAAWFGCIAMTLGTCGAYIVFISSVGTEMATGQPGFEHWTKGKHTVVWTVLTCGLLIPFSWLREYRFLAPTSLFGVTALLFALMMTVSDCFRNYDMGLIGTGMSGNSTGIEIKQFRADSYPLFLGNAAFLYLMSTAIMPLEQGMSNRENFHRPFSASMIVVTIINLAFGFIAYLSYGDCEANGCEQAHDGSYAADCCTKGNVLDNLKVKAAHELYVVVKICLAVDLFFTTMLYLFPMAELFEKALFTEAQFGQPRVEIKRNALRAGIVVAIGLIAQAIPDFQLLTGLSGGFGNNIIAFVLPPIFYAKLRAMTGYWAPLSSDAILAGDSAGCWLAVEVLLLVISWVFGVALLFLSTSSFVAAIASN